VTSFFSAQRSLRSLFFVDFYNYPNDPTILQTYEKLVSLPQHFGEIQK
jgi:hypothetical protein